MAKKKSKSSKQKSADISREQQSVIVKVADLEEPQESAAPIWVDRMHLLAREEGIMTLIFESAIPDRNQRVEVCRLVMTAPLAKSVAEVIARQMKRLEKP